MDESKIKKQQLLTSIYGLKAKPKIEEQQVQKQLESKKMKQTNTEKKIEKNQKFDSDEDFAARAKIKDEKKPIFDKHEMWIDKYRPTSFNQMVGLKKDIGVQIDMFLASRIQKPYSSMQMLLLSGPNGVGKTIVAELMLKKMKFSNIIHLHPGSFATVKSSAAIKDEDEDDENDSNDESELQELDDGGSIQELKEGKKDKTGINVETVYSLVEKLSRENYKNTAIIINDIDALGGNFSLKKFAKLLTLHKDTVKKKIAKLVEQRNEEIKEKLGQESKKKNLKRKRKIDETKVFGLPARFSVPLCTIIATTSLLSPFSDKKKMGALKTNCAHVAMDKLEKCFLVKLANRIIEAEKMTISEKELKTILESSQGDARRLVNLLQFFSIRPDSIEKKRAEIVNDKEMDEKTRSKMLKGLEKTQIQLIEDAEADIFQQDLFDTAQEMFQTARQVDMDKAQEYLNYDSMLLPAMLRENYLSFYSKYKQNSSIESMESVAEIADFISDGDALCPSVLNSDHPENAFGSESEKIGKLLTMSSVLPSLPAFLPSKGKLYLKFPTNELSWHSSAKSKKNRWKLLYETMNMHSHRPFEMQASEFPQEAFQCMDKKWIYLDCGSQHWTYTMSILKLENWSSEHGLSDQDVRFSKQDMVLKMLAAQIAKYSHAEMEIMLPTPSETKEWIELARSFKSCSGIAFIGNTLDKITHAQAIARYCTSMEKWLAKNNPKQMKKLQKERDDLEKEKELKKDQKGKPPPRKRRKLGENEVITEHQQFASHHNPVGIAVPRLCSEYGLLTFEDIAEISKLVEPFTIEMDVDQVRQEKFGKRTLTYLSLFGKKSLDLLLALA